MQREGVESEREGKRREEEAVSLPSCKCASRVYNGHLEWPDAGGNLFLSLAVATVSLRSEHGTS